MSIHIMCPSCGSVSEWHMLPVTDCGTCRTPYPDRIRANAESSLRDYVINEEPVSGPEFFRGAGFSFGLISILLLGIAFGLSLVYLVIGFQIFQWFFSLSRRAGTQLGQGE